MSYVEQGLTFKNTDFGEPYEVPILTNPPFRDPDNPNCLVCVSGLPLLAVGKGKWRLRTPLNLATLMPGTNRQLTSVSVRGASVVSWGTIVAAAETNIVLLRDNQSFFRADRLVHTILEGGHSGGFENDFKTANGTLPQVILDAYSQLDIVIEQLVGTYIGYAAHHDYDVSIGYAYFSSVPPALGDVEVTVTNLTTGAALPNLTVRLLAGAKVIKQATTNSLGVASMLGVPTGQYTLRVYGKPASIFQEGYEDQTMQVTIASGTVNAFNVPLTSLPRLSIPWYMWAAGAGIAVIGVLAIKQVPTIIMPIIERVRRRETEE